MLLDALKPVKRLITIAKPLPILTSVRYHFALAQTVTDHAAAQIFSAVLTSYEYVMQSRMHLPFRLLVQNPYWHSKMISRGIAVISVNSEST
jgi:hypothetical protein